MISSHILDLFSCLSNAEGLKTPSLKDQEIFASFLCMRKVLRHLFKESPITGLSYAEVIEIVK